jgi:hypothetical protein
VTKKRLYCTTTREKESEREIEKHTQINKEKKRDILF